MAFAPAWPPSVDARCSPRAAPRVASVSRRSELRISAVASAAVLRQSAYRLRGARAFEAVFRGGTRFDGCFLQLIAAPAAGTPGRVGYVIARRAIPRAVDRNRLRRRLREAVRVARPALTRFDLILRVRGAIARRDIGAAAAEGRELIARVAAHPDGAA